jgi:hypothetical protein
MFGKKKVINAVEEAEKVIETKIPATPELIKSRVIPYVQLLEKERTEGDEHTKKYLQILERDSTENHRKLDIDFIDAVKKEGFNLLVPVSAIEDFKYCALVYTYHDISGITHVTADGANNVLYIGDVPDFALDRIHKLREIRKDQFITIHSNVELPVKYEAHNFRDPVIIAWNDTAPFGKRKNKWCVEDYRHTDISVGCVVAMWGDDGQPL